MVESDERLCNQADVPAALRLCMEVYEGMRRGGMSRRNTSGAYFFFYTAVGLLGVTPSINIFAKETFFRGTALRDYLEFTFL